jgi:S-ribosylhomocysteine lyase LuxS involved in autoinducer biosynthesis
MQVLLVRSTIAKARQKKLFENISKVCGTLQNKELYDAKDEEEKVLFHTENIAHSDDHVFLDSRTRCSLEHDTQTFSYLVT